MNKIVAKLKLHNFRRFREFSVDFNDEMNLLIGDNESGKSSILQALDLVMSGSKSKVDTLSLESLMNIDIISEYLAGTKAFEDLPVMWAEVYLNEQNNPDLNGKNHSEGIDCRDGLKLDNYRMFQDTVPDSNLRKHSENIINMISTFNTTFYNRQIVLHQKK